VALARGYMALPNRASKAIEAFQKIWTHLDWIKLIGSLTFVADLKVLVILACLDIYVI
jgi:hypothetical protein